MSCVSFVRSQPEDWMHARQRVNTVQNRQSARIAAKLFEEAAESAALSGARASTLWAPELGKSIAFGLHASQGESIGYTAFRVTRRFKPWRANNSFKDTHPHNLPHNFCFTHEHRHRL